MALLRGIGRPLRLAVIWAACAFGLTILLAAAAPVALGDRSYVVRSGSMAPAIDTGDVVVVEPISPASAKVGDIVTFEDPEGTGKLITHRARAITHASEKVEFTTQGDANTAQERWSVPAGEEVGRVLYRVPKLGFAITVITSPAGRIGLVIVPALLLAVSLVARIWRRDETGGRVDELPA
jgi:signal peptidase